MRHPHTLESLTQLVCVDPAELRELAERFAGFVQEYDRDSGTVTDAGRKLLLGWYAAEDLADLSATLTNPARGT